MPTDRQQYCKKCHRRFTRPQGTNRLNCYDCRPERKVVPLSSAKSAQSAQSAGSGQNQDQIPDEDGSLAKLTKKSLDEAGVLETWQGESAMALARLIDAGKHGASGAAGTVKALREAMGVALADSGEDADIITMIFEQDA